MRLDRDTFREIADSLTRNRTRSLLTGFGIFWGIFMLIFLLGGGRGLKDMLAENFEGFASNTTVLYADVTGKPFKGLKKGRSWALEVKDAERLKMMVPELDVVTTVVSQYGLSAVKDDKSKSVSLKGVKADYALVEATEMKYGRYLNDVDILQERKVCVIGKNVYTSLFPQGGDPCGQRIKVGGVDYVVVGVDTRTSGISLNGSSQNSVVIPFPLLSKLYNRGNTTDMICLTAKEGVVMSELEGKIRGIVARSHRFDPTDKDALGVLFTEEFFAVIDNIFKGVNFLILLIGLGTILAGAIGVSNIMMVTVRERTTEIGIRRAIGATPRDILSQIMAESIALTAVSGTFGIVFTVIILGIMEAAGDGTAFQISFWTAVSVLALLCILGVLAGLAPASRAMDIKPVDAMRDE